MRALTMDELSFVSGGSGSDSTSVMETIIVWGKRNGVNFSGGGSGGGGGGGSQNYAASDAMVADYDKLPVSPITWWNQFTPGEQMEMIGGAIALSAGLAGVALTAPAVVTALGVLAVGTAGPAALAAAKTTVIAFVLSAIAAAGGATALAGMARG